MADLSQRSLFFMDPRMGAPIRAPGRTAPPWAQKLELSRSRFPGCHRTGFTFSPAEELTTPAQPGQRLL